MRDKTKKSVYKYFVILGICFVAFIVMLLSFANMSDQYGKTFVEKNLLKTMELYAIQIENSLKVAEASSASFGEFITETKFTSQEQVEKVSEIIIDNSDSFQVVICDANGSGIYNDGEITQIQLQDKTYFGVIQNVTEPRYLYVKDDEFRQEECVIYIYPFVENDEVEGFILTYMSKNIVEDIINDQSLLANGFYTIIDNSGTVIGTVGNSNSELYSEYGFFNHLLNVADVYENAEKIQKWSLSGISGYQQLSSAGEEKIFFITPIGIQNWYLVAGLDNRYIEQQGIAEWASIKEMLIVTSIIASVIVFIVIGMAVGETVTRMARQRKLEDKADTDLLTGLNNKIATERKIKRYLAEAIDEKAILFIVDIDNFKKINDTKGHAFGDEVLQALGEQLSLEYDFNDILGRSGGDEFLILKRGVTTEIEIGNQMKKLSNFFDNFKVGEYVKYKVTASIGATIFPDDYVKFDDLYKAADQALYVAKRRGKNQLARFDDHNKKK